MQKFRDFGKRMVYGDPNKKDVLPDQYPKREPQRFFAFLKLYITRVISLNLLYCLFMLPIFAWVMLNVWLNVFYDITALLAYLPTFLLILLPLLILGGLPLSGISYICNRWARDEHAYVWGDFKDAIKANWKQALILQSISSAASALATFSIFLYSRMDGAGEILTTLAMGMLVLVFSLVSMMNIFIIPLCVRYHMRARDILRNSFILAIVRLPQCLGITLLSQWPILLMIFLPETLPFVGMYYIIIGLGLKHFLRGYFAQKVFEKYIPVASTGNTDE